jgi:hypothetical protein
MGKEMSGSRQKSWRVKISFPEEQIIHVSRARTEEDAIEQAREAWEQEIVRNYLKYSAEEMEEEE